MVVLHLLLFSFLSLGSRYLLSQADDALSLRRSLTAVRSGYFHQLSYTDSTCSSYLATAKVMLLGQCYKSLNGFTSNTALLDFPVVGMATLNSSYFSDASCSKPAVSIYSPQIKSVATKIPTTCTLGTVGAGGYYQIGTISSTMMTFPTTSCALVSKSYQYANCSGTVIQSNFQVLNLCLQGITLYTCPGTSVTASVCGNNAMASTSSCQAIASSPSGAGFGGSDAPFEYSACVSPPPYSPQCVNYQKPTTAPSSSVGSCGATSSSCKYISKSSGTRQITRYYGYTTAIPGVGYCMSMLWGGWYVYLGMVMMTWLLVWDANIT